MSGLRCMSGGHVEELIFRKKAVTSDVRTCPDRWGRVLGCRCKGEGGIRVTVVGGCGKCKDSSGYWGRAFQPGELWMSML